MRRYLGIADLPSVEMYKAMEKRQSDRHKELLGVITELRITLQAAHVTRPFIAPAIEDWDSAQVAQMIEMQRNPEKEH